MPRSTSVWSGAVMAAISATAVLAASPPGGPGGPPPPGRSTDLPHPPSAEARLARLTAMLQLTPAQVAAAAAFVADAEPPDRGDRPGPDSEAFAAMTTPERLDRLAVERKTIEAQMDKVEAATRRLYAALTPAQKAAFDAMPPPMALHVIGPPMGGRMGPPRP